MTTVDDDNGKFDEDYHCKDDDDFNNMHLYEVVERSD